MAQQAAWRFCDRCFGMFFNGDHDPDRRGACPAKGAHRAQGFVFTLPFDVSPSSGQPDWRFCSKCFGMFFNGDPDPNRRGKCPADGTKHEAFGFNFVLPHDVPETGGQPEWRFCSKCFGMFFNGDADPNRRGKCPADGTKHEAFGFNFVLPHSSFPRPLSEPSVERIDDSSVSITGTGFTENGDVEVRYDYKTAVPTRDGPTTFHSDQEPVIFTASASGVLGGVISAQSGEGKIVAFNARAVDLFSGDATTAGALP